ncbi:PKD domain-containing protein [Paenibacillus sp.]|uniref:PKD domain-containing protein n=1 Tax=Paenibacillus sp. TaxID=58172 RepID=UPI002D3A9EE9|nr:IPT/TIG domain protein [Paenibacillus sp.]HZG83484.1 IPT/TIG domain protein [Paenibacillus sp.]
MLTVGPISAANGYPVWYKDENGLRLQLNTDPNDPYSGITPADLPNPSAPVSFPDNFPSESFYFSAEAEMETGTGGRARLVLALEAAFVNEVPTPGEQIVFGRVRVRARELIPGAVYTVYHPYGVETFEADDEGEINFTEDIGDMDGGGFEQAGNSRIHPFLRWDPAVAPAPPPGYIGDPNVLHRIVGSPVGRNYFRIEGPDIGVGSPDRVSDDAIETRLFAVLGTISTIAGVDIVRASYTRTEASGGLLDVFASTDTTPQQLVVSGPGFDPTVMQGGQGEYLAHIAFDGGVPNEITVTNVGDQPPSVKTAEPADLLTGTAVYDLDTSELTVTGSSSDTFGAPTLTAVGFASFPSGGTLVRTLPDGVPASVEITSEAGGSIEIPVYVEGNPFEPIGVSADAGPDQTVLINRTVTLDGTGSTGPIASYAWTQVAGPAVTLSDADEAIASFAAPGTAASLEFALTVTGPGGPSVDTTAVQVVTSAPAPIANAGPDQTVRQGTVVTLQGSSNVSPVSFEWEQIAGPAVTLNGADTPNPTFTFPKQPLPLRFRLTVTGPGGSSSDTVQISALPDALTVTRAEYRIGDAEWRVEGTTDVPGPGVSITIHIGSSTAGPVLAVAEADPLGEWGYRDEGAAPQPDDARTVTLRSSSGGRLTAVPLTVRQ